MKLIIAGSRNITDEEEVYNAFKKSPFVDKASMIISGHARGVDIFGEALADSYLLDKVIFPANWERYGTVAGVIRNKHMGEYADALLAVWDGKSKGTANMIKIMQDLGKPIHIYETTIS